MVYRVSTIPAWWCRMSSTVAIEIGTVTENTHHQTLVRRNHIWLVVWNIFYFPILIGFLIIPIDFHIFQRGGPTTNQIFVCETPWQLWGYLGVSSSWHSLSWRPWPSGKLTDVATKNDTFSSLIYLYNMVIFHMLRSGKPCFGETWWNSVVNPIAGG